MNTHAPLDSAVRVALVLGAALVAMPLLRRHSATARRLVLSIAFVASLLLPFAPSRAVAIHVEAPAVHELVARVVAEPAVSGAAPVPALPRTALLSIDWLALVWALGALAVLLRSLSGFVLASRVARRAFRSEAWAAAERAMGQPVEVRVSTSVQTPAVAGVFRPIILVPAGSEEWSESRKRSVLLHELAHVAARDLQVQLVAAIACSLHWFNPLAWLAARRLRLERELAADESVLRTGLRATSYAEDLLAIAGASLAGTVAAGTPPLAKRIAAIVAARRPARLGRASAVMLASSSGAIALSVACTNVTEPPRVMAAAPAAPAPARSNDEPASANTTPPVASPELQKLVSTELRQTVATWKAAGGAILVLTPKGEVVAEAGDVDRTVVVGSVMKPILLSAAFEEGAVTETDVFDAGASKMPVGELLAKSNNPGFARIFERVGSVKLSRVLLGFHFANPRTLDADAAIGGTMPGTPRQVAQAYASLASGGGGVVSERTASRVSKLMEGVVATEDGTGKKARIAGQRVAGKTGTSEWTDETKHTYASFVGYVPAEAPRYVIYVGVESAVGSNPWGGEVAAPVFARIATQSLAR